MKTGEKLTPPSLAERVAVCRRHLEFSIRWKGPVAGVFEMRRHYTNYFRGLENFKPFRMRLVEGMSFEELDGILNEVVHEFSEAVC